MNSPTCPKCGKNHTHILKGGQEARCRSCYNLWATIGPNWPSGEYPYDHLSGNSQPGAAPVSLGGSGAANSPKLIQTFSPQVVKDCTDMREDPEGLYVLYSAHEAALQSAEERAQRAEADLGRMTRKRDEQKTGWEYSLTQCEKKEAELADLRARLAERDKPLQLSLEAAAKNADERDQSRANVARLRADLAAARKWITRYVPEDFADHACAQCRPHSEILINGFACEVHKALAATPAEPAVEISKGGDEPCLTPPASASIPISECTTPDASSTLASNAAPDGPTPPEAAEFPFRHSITAEGSLLCQFTSYGCAVDIYPNGAVVVICNHGGKEHVLELDAPKPAISPATTAGGEDDEVLKRCPFCGGEAEIVNAPEAGESAHVVACKTCQACSMVVFSLREDGKPRLVELWNRRQPTQPEGDAKDGALLALAESWEVESRQLDDTNRERDWGEAAGLRNCAEELRAAMAQTGEARG